MRIKITLLDECVNNGLINYLDTKAKCRQLKI